MNLKNLDFSILVTENLREFTTSLSDIKYAHEKIMELRNLVWEDESTANFCMKFKELGLTFRKKNDK